MRRKGKQLLGTWKQGLAFLLTVVVLLSSVPLPVLAEGVSGNDTAASSVSGNRTGSAETEQESSAAESTPSVSGNALGSGAHEMSISGNDIEEVSEEVKKVQALIDALPTVEEVKAMNDEDRNTAYNKTQEAYEALTEDEQAQINAAKIEALFGYFNGMVSTTADVIYISTANDLMDFATKINNSTYPVTQNAELTADIDMSGKVFTPITRYEGTFNGNNHTISNLGISSPEVKHVGLFGQIQNATIKNVGVTGNISGKDQVGGIVGKDWGGSTIENCWNGADISCSDQNAGGIIGWSDNSESSVKNCYNYGTVTANKGYAGGIVGTLWPGTVENCFNYGAVTNGGAIAGYIDGGTVSNCYYLKKDGLDGGGGIGVTEEVAKSGEVTWMLNGNKANGVWKQSIGTNNYPSFSGGTVYQYSDGTYGNSQGFDISVSASPADGGTVSGGVTNIRSGTEITVSATPATGYHFVGWTENGNTVSDAASRTYTFNVTKNRNLVAKFQQVSASYFQFTPPGNLTYDGNGKAAAVTAVQYTGELTADKLTVKYFKDGTQLPNGTLPVAAGTYTVKIDIAETTNFAECADLTDTAWTFMISPLKETTPAAKIDYITERLTGLTPNGTYAVAVNGAAASNKGADENGTITFDGSWIGTTDTTVTIKKPALDANHIDSEVQILTIPTRPETPDVAGVNTRYANTADGKITGVTVAMEYRKKDDTAWKNCTGTEITGLAVGTYEVRVKAVNGADVDSSNFASQATEVTITSESKNNAPIGGSGGGTNGNGSNNSQENSPSTLPTLKPEETKPIELPILKPSEPNRPIKVESDKEEPFIKGDAGQNGWPVITDKTEAAKPGDTVTVDMNGATTVPGNVIESIAGRDVTVVFDMGKGILWTVNGLSVTAENIEDINFGVTKNTRNIPVDVINNVTGECYSMTISIEHNGEFGFTATLTINMKKENVGLYANLFYYNPEAEAGNEHARGELEFICADQIDANGNADLEFTHASDYTIVIDTESMEPELVADADTDADGTDSEVEAEGATNDTTDTVDSDNALWVVIAVIVILALAGIAGYVYFVSKKKNEE